MLSIYALDPDLMTNYADFRFFVSCFGFDKGRLIAEYPNKWKRRIYESLQGSPMDKKRIEIALGRIDSRLAKQKGRSFDKERSWLDNAIAQNAINPFHAIVSRQFSQKFVANLINADHIDDTLAYEQLEQDDPRLLWRAPTSKVILRDAKEMASEISQLLSTSKHIRFVDGYFGPDSSSHRRPFREFMKLLIGRNMSSIKVEFHCRQIMPEQHFLDKCEDWVTPSIPAGMTVKFFRWKNDDLHNRFIITEKGGVAFLEGLTSYQGTGREKDVIALLHNETIALLNQEFDRETTSMTLVDSIAVKGTMT